MKKMEKGASMGKLPSVLIAACFGGKVWVERARWNLDEQVLSVQSSYEEGRG